MQNIYIICAEYGQWEDHTSVEMYVATEEAAARNRLQSLADEFSAAFAHMVEGICHGIRPFDSVHSFQGDEHVAEVARQGYWDNGVELSLWVMPVGKTFRSSELVERKGLSFFPEGWDEDRVEREGELLVASKYELMAEPYEDKYGA